MFHWKVEKGQHPILVFDQRLDGLGIASPVPLLEKGHLFQSAFPIRRTHDLVQLLFGPGLPAPGQLIQHVGDLVLPAALFLRFWKDAAQRRPEAEVAIADGQNGGGHAPSFEVSEDSSPRFGGLPLAIFQGDDLFPAIGQDADDHQTGQAVLLQANVEVDAVGPDVDILLANHRPFVPGFVLFCHTFSRRVMVVAENPAASGPKSTSNASAKSPVDSPRK